MNVTDNEIKTLMHTEAYRNPKSKNDPEYLKAKEKIDSYYQKAAEEKKIKETEDAKRARRP